MKMIRCSFVLLVAGWCATSCTAQTEAQRAAAARAKAEARAQTDADRQAQMAEKARAAAEARAQAEAAAKARTQGTKPSGSQPGTVAPMPTPTSTPTPADASAPAQKITPPKLSDPMTVSPAVKKEGAKPRDKAERPAKTSPKNIKSGSQKVPSVLSQEQQLKELKELYKADKISPADYHQRRMQILRGQ